MVEVVVGIHIIELVWPILMAHSEVNHQLARLLVVYSLWCPGTSYIGKFGRHLVDIYHGVRPVDEVVRLHQHQSTVVAPAVCSTIALPLGRAFALALGIDVQVGGGKIEGTIGSAVYMRVAHTTLLGYSVATDNGLRIIKSCEMVAVTTQSHIQAMRIVTVKHHKISRHLLLTNRLLTSCRDYRQWQHKQEQNKL